MHQERAQQFDRILRVEPSPKIIQGTINCHRIPKMSKCLDLPANKIEVGSHSTKERFVLGFVYELEKGSIVIGLGLANVAWFIIRSNTKYLVGQSISQIGFHNIYYKVLWGWNNICISASKYQYIIYFA